MRESILLVGLIESAYLCGVFGNEIGLLPAMVVMFFIGIGAGYLVDKIYDSNI